MKSLFPYVGGKHRVAKKLVQLFPEHTCYVEMFAGAANLIFAKEPGKTEVINDINSDLVNIFRVIRWHADEFLKELTLITHSRQEFLDYHDQHGLTDVQRAARYWFKLKTTWGGTAPAGHKGFSVRTSGRSILNADAYDTIRQAYNRLDGVTIENDDFEAVIRRYDRNYTFFFCDPPYWQAADYGVPFKWCDHQRLAHVLRNIKGKFLLTINDHPDIRKLYQGLKMRKVPMQYTVAPGINKQKVYELLISNYPLPRRR